MEALTEQNSNVNSQKVQPYEFATVDNNSKAVLINNEDVDDSIEERRKCKKLLTQSIIHFDHMNIEHGVNDKEKHHHFETKLYQLDSELDEQEAQKILEMKEDNQNQDLTDIICTSFEKHFDNSKFKTLGQNSQAFRKEAAYIKQQEEEQDEINLSQNLPMIINRKQSNSLMKQFSNLQQIRQSTVTLQLFAQNRNNQPKTSEKKLSQVKQKVSGFGSQIISGVQETIKSFSNQNQLKIDVSEIGLMDIYNVYDTELFLNKLAKAHLISKFEQTLYPENDYDLIDFQRNIQTYEVDGQKKKVMIISAYQICLHENGYNTEQQGRPIVMIYHLEDEQEKEPKIIYKKWLNNIEYKNCNFVHPTVYAQNGIFLYFVVFESNIEQQQHKGSLVKLNIITCEEESQDLEFDLDKISDGEPIFGLFANFSTMICEKNHKSSKQIDEELFIRSTYFEIQYETFDMKQFCGDIRKLSSPNDTMFNHQLEEYEKDRIKYECIDYISSDGILYKNKVANINDRVWKNKQKKVKKQIEVKKNGKLLLNKPKKIEIYDERIGQIIDKKLKEIALSGIYLVYKQKFLTVADQGKINGWSFKRTLGEGDQRDMVRNVLGIEKSPNIDLKLYFFKDDPLSLKIKAYSNNKYIENEYFLGCMQKQYSESEQNLFTEAAYNDLGIQFDIHYSNIFIKEDQDDKEIYLSVLNKNEKNEFDLKQIILDSDDLKNKMLFKQFGDKIYGKSMYGVSLELSQVNNTYQLSVRGDKQVLNLRIAEYSNMEKTVKEYPIQMKFDYDIYDMLCVCWGSPQYKQDSDDMDRLYQDIHWCQIHESKLFGEILVFQLSWLKSVPYFTNQGIKLKLIGKKLVLFNKKYDATRNTYVPIYSKNQQIIGHQWIPEGSENDDNIQQKGFYAQMLIEENNENYQFATDIAISKFNQIYEKNNLRKPLLTIIESELSPTMMKYVKNGQFKDNEIMIILDRQIRTILNIHQTEGKHLPFMFGLLNEEEQITQIKQELLKTCDFFQPIEILRGQCLANFFIRDPSQLQVEYSKIRSRMKQNLKGGYKSLTSLIETHLSNLQENESKELREYLENEGLIRFNMQLTYDLFGQTPLHRALMNVTKLYKGEDIEYIRTEQILAAKFILDKMFLNEQNYESEQRTLNEQHIIRELLPVFLECVDEPFPFDSISNFFNHFEAKDKKNNLNPNFFQFNTNLELDRYLNESAISISIQSQNLYFKTQDEIFYNQMVEIKEKLKENDKKIWKQIKRMFFKRLDKYQVKYLLIDRTAPRIYAQINEMRKYEKENPGSGSFHSLENVSSKPINSLIHAINQHFASDIGNHIVLQKIIDAYFEKTKKFYLIFGVFYILFNFIPFLLQIYLYGKDKNQVGIYVCNSMIIVVSFLIFLMECIVLKAAGSVRNYLQKSVFNLVDIPISLIQIGYSIHRINYPNEEILPGVLGDDLIINFKIDHLLFISGFNVILTIFQLSQILKFLTVIEEFGKIIDLSFKVIWQVFYFLVYYQLWILILAIIYGQLGLTIDIDLDHENHEEYARLSRFAKLYLYAFRNSVGDISPPDASYWDLFKNEENNEKEKSLVVHGILWVLWVLNIFYMVIILLNFLISIVSKAHDEALEIELETTYTQKCELNYEWDVIKKHLPFFFPNYKESDVFVIAATFNEEDEDKEQFEEEMAAIKRVETSMKEEFQNVNEKHDLMNAKYDQMNAKYDELTQKVDVIIQMMKDKQ